MPAQRAVFAMVSLLLRIERESQGRVRVCRNVDDIQQGIEDGVLAHLRASICRVALVSYWLRRQFPPAPVIHLYQLRALNYQIVFQGRKSQLLQMY
jgi:hypothetical protein